MDSTFGMNDFLHLLRKKILYLIFIPIAFAGVGFYISYYAVTPVYEARVDLLVNNTVPTGDDQLSSMDIETNLRLIESYQFIIQSDFVLDKVVAKTATDMSMTSVDLKNKLRIETNNNSQIISLYIRDENVEHAVIMVNAIAKTVKSEIHNLMKIENIQILTIAKEEKYEVPIVPKPIIYTVISFFIGMLTTLIHLFFTAYFQMRIGSKEDIDKFIKVPLLGKVSKIRAYADNRRPSKKSVIPHDLSTRRIKMAPEVMESFRTIRTNIQFQSKVSNLQTILITSASKNEGKSVTSKHLAMMMAFARKKTVIIDADFRKEDPGKIRESLGLSTYLAGDDNLDHIVMETATNDLKMIPSGPSPPMPTELLSSYRMDELLQKLKKRFDFIIIDSPPLFLADAPILATKTDGCILVIQADKTKVKHIRGAIEQLKQVNASILGTVLNKAKVPKRAILEYNNTLRWKRNETIIQKRSSSHTQ